MLPTEVLQLQAFGYRRYWIVHLYCNQDGLLRLALAYDPEDSDHLPCPVCAQSCACGVLPCLGFTRRPLPFHNRLMPPINRIWLCEDEAEGTEPVRELDSDHYISPSGRVAQLPPKVYRRRYPVPAP